MRLFKEVAIIGPGLIGGSLALALKRKRLAVKVIAVSRRQRTIALARKIKAIDAGSRDLGSVKNADLIIIATPVNTILKLADTLKGIIRQDCMVMDVGSSKEKIVAKLENLFPYYVGTHPLAGSQKQGISSARPDMFRDSLCILTPTKKTSPRALRKIKKLWRMLGARTISLTPAQHDKTIAMVSHLPHSVSFALIGAIPKDYLKYGASGLQDTTRIAGSDSVLWTDIFLSNRKNILKAIALFEENLARIKKAIQKNNPKLLKRKLRQAQEKRDLFAKYSRDDNCH